MDLPSYYASHILHLPKRWIDFGILLDWEYGLARDSELNVLVEIPEPEMPEGAVAG